MADRKASHPYKAVIFDFGGVLAEEGFSLGLRAIGLDNGLDPEETYLKGSRLVLETGYLTGKASEKVFWEAFRKETGIALADEGLRREILDRFVIRPWMLEHVRRISDAGLVTAILSDQTNWLDELDRRLSFFGFFDVVQNSFHCGKSKHETGAFTCMLERLECIPRQALFFDDNPGHVKRARSVGIDAIQFTRRSAFEDALSGRLGGS